VIGLREIEATQRTIRELREAGDADRAAMLTAVLEAATAAITSRRTGGPRPFMTTGEVARALGVSVQTVKNWGDAGRLRVVQMGGRHYVAREDLLAYLDGLRARPRPPGPFDEPGVDDTRVRAVLPVSLVARIDALHDAVERGEPLDRAAAEELRGLEATAARLTAEYLRAGRPARR